MEENYKSSRHREDESSIDLKKILNVFWGMRWLIVLSVVACLIAAYAYIRLTRARHTANAQIMLVVNGGNNSELLQITDLMLNKGNSRVTNEMEIISSRSMMQRVVEDLGLNYTYSKKRPVKTLYYYGNNPFSVTVDSTENYPNPPTAQIVFVPKDSTSFRFSKITIDNIAYPFEKDSSIFFGEPFPLGGHTLVIDKTNLNRFEIGDTYFISMLPSYATAGALKGNLTVSGETKASQMRSEVIKLSFVDIFPQRAEDILNSLILNYNQDAREFNGMAINNTIDFLNDRLELLEDELGALENQVQNYRRSNTVVDVASQSQLTLSTDAKYEEQLSSIEIQIELLNIVKNYVNSMGQPLSVIPANIGITDLGLNSTINQFNTLLMERNRMVASSSESNPLVIQADNQLQELLSSVVSSVRNLEKSYQLQYDTISAKLRQSKSRLSAIPTQQQEISRFGRQQKIKEPLFILLQQKKEEALISLYAITDQCKIIDTATHTARQTAPNRRMIFLIAFFLGLIIPPAIFFIRQALKSRVEGKLDITQRTDIPILASIPISEHPGELMKVTGREPFEETIRILRSNVRYLGHKLYQVTSSVPGEGKSYISANLALSLAHTGYKVLLVGIDLRKPKQAQIFGVHQHRNQGLVPYLVGRNDDLNDSIVHGCAGIETLDLLPAGSIPPNPSELIESQKMADTIEYLKSLDYDYIIFDSAPYLPVADASTMNRYVDANIFMLRVGVCDLKFVEDLDEAVREKRLKNVYIVLNGVDIKARSYGYHYGYGYGHYGYGKNKYGYGYGYGYGDKKKVGHSETEPVTK